jgi:hypothetical protein
VGFKIGTVLKTVGFSVFTVVITFVESTIDVIVDDDLCCSICNLVVWLLTIVLVFE